MDTRDPSLGGPAGAAPGDREPDPWVLLVEDDETLAGLLADHLGRRGITARVSPTVAHAVDRLRHEPPPALIVLDINLPDGAGWDLVRDPAYRAAGAPPMVVASAVTVRPHQLADAGAAGHLPKPFALRTFMDIVERHLRPAAEPAVAQEEA